MKIQMKSKMDLWVASTFIINFKNLVRKLQGKALIKD